MAVGDSIVQQVPISNRRLLQPRVVGLGDQRSVGQVVDMGSVTDEREVRIREDMQPGTGIRYSGHGICGVIGCLLQPHARDSGQKPLLVTKVNVRGLVTHPHGLRQATQAEAFRGFVRQHVEGGPKELVAKAGANSGIAPDRLPK
jgi:hypothetical protein